MKNGAASLQAVRERIVRLRQDVLRLADVAGVDITTAAKQKLQSNAEKYPPGNAGPEPPASRP